MALQVFKITFSYNQSKIYKAAIIVLYLGYWIFGIVPFTNNYKIYTTFVTLWCCEITLTTYLAFTCHEFGGDGYTLNGLISIAFYITHMLGHLAILIESSARVQQRIELFERFSNIRNSFEEKLEASKELEIFAVRLSRIVIVILVMLACGHGCVMWTTLKTQSAACLLYWRFLQSYLALQFKTLEFLTGLLQINYYILIIRQTINAVGERNLKKVFQRLNKSPNATVIYITPQNEEEEEIDEQLLELLKNSYNEVYVTFLAYNSVYGWSLLFSTAVYFVDFVCNSYWILLAALTQGRDYYGLLQNASFALMAFVLIFLSCFYAEECYDESRYIGCLISKLVKPLGNKRYNDLVSEFSIQTLHQRFIITAKEFFSLNLSLLGSMVAAIVTYLVILIQFMFTEKDKTKDGWIYKSISFTLNTTSTFKTH